LQENKKIILGIDPGTVIMGYALLRVNGSKVEMIEMNAVRLNGKKDMFERLRQVHETINQVIQKHGPEELAIEAPFFGKNVQSMLKLGRAQGVAMAAALQNGLPVAEYSPRRIKQAITGNGNATKEKVWDMLQHILGIRQKMVEWDASDALAVAVCHHFIQQSPVSEKIHGSRKPKWEDFIRDNPDRVQNTGHTKRER
jgi:crossover junction endodeoxyribonuclease RuvC